MDDQLSGVLVDRDDDAIRSKRARDGGQRDLGVAPAAIIFEPEGHRPDVPGVSLPVHDRRAASARTRIGRSVRYCVSGRPIPSSHVPRGEKRTGLRATVAVAAVAPMTAATAPSTSSGTTTVSSRISHSTKQPTDQQIQTPASEGTPRGAGDRESVSGAPVVIARGSRSLRTDAAAAISSAVEGGVRWSSCRPKNSS